MMVFAFSKSESRYTAAITASKALAKKRIFGAAAGAIFAATE